MAAIISDKLNGDAVDFFLRSMSDVETEQPKSSFFAFVDASGAVQYRYMNLSVDMMRLIADALRDEAMLRVIAANPDKIDEFRDTLEDDDSSST